MNGELLKVRQDGEVQLGGPGVAAQLVGRVDVVLDVYGGLLGLDEELVLGSYAEAAAWHCDGASGAHGSFVNDLLVAWRDVLAVVDVSTQGDKEGVNELAGDLDPAVTRAAVVVDVCGQSARRGPCDGLGDWSRAGESPFGLVTAVSVITAVDTQRPEMA